MFSSSFSSKNSTNISHSDEEKNEEEVRAGGVPVPMPAFGVGVASEQITIGGVKHDDSHSDGAAALGLSGGPIEAQSVGEGGGADYETEQEQDYESEDNERMQLNPSTDLYDDDDDDEDYDDDSLYGDDNDDDVAADTDDDVEPESLPVAKGLVQPADEEEEDMGYDEDDERIAMERPRTAPRPTNDEKHFMNEEGSGGGGGGARQRFKPHEAQASSSSFRLGQLETIRKKLLNENTNVGGEVDLRESSGNFANDDEDGEDDDDVGDADDDDGDQSYEDGGDEPRAGFFNSKRKSTNHYFRKNTNDAIKIISTPLGKVGIVYQQTPTGDEKKSEGADKKSATFTDFDALSPDPESSHRLASSHPKITPVLTPDGKVALLYRGDSESSKYEPIRNLTHKFNNKNPEANKENNDGKTATSNNNNSNFKLDIDDSDSGSDNDGSSSSSAYGDNGDDNADNAANNGGQTDIDAGGVKFNEPDPDNGGETATDGTFVIRPTDSVLPMINRPLSEVLGIKKNQFKQIRVKDTPTTTSTETLPRTLAGGAAFDNNNNGDTTTLHFLTKVNLADYPTSSRTLNRDFDFSRDNTMLDERSRFREQQAQQHNEATKGGITENSVANTLANEEILSKTEVVNLAIIPHFDEDMERLQRLAHDSSRRHHRARHRHKQTEEDLSGIHCIMQVMMGIAAISTVFGMLGTFFKQRILDQLRMMHW